MGGIEEKGHEEEASKVTNQKGDKRREPQHQTKPAERDKESVLAQVDSIYN
jgi:hypothetical protein